MAALSQKELLKQYKKTPAYAVQRFNLARTNLLLALALTVLNILFYCLNLNVYMLFSIAFPYFMFDLADPVSSILAVLVLAGYFALYLFSKRKPRLMIVTLIAFIIDFLFLIGYSIVLVGLGEGITFGEFIIDYATHIWVLVYLIIGTKFSGRYKAAITADPSLLEGSLFKNAALPPVETTEETAEPVQADAEQQEQAAEEPTSENL